MYFFKTKLNGWLIIKALNFAYNAYSAGSVYLSENLGANELHNKGSFGELL
jgi:hypothetical protein